jgi:hypothetical protein
MIIKKEKRKMAMGPRWVPDTKMVWLAGWLADRPSIVI